MIDVMNSDKDVFNMLNYGIEGVTTPWRMVL